MYKVIQSVFLGNRLTTLGPRDLAGLINLQHLIINNNQLVKVSVQAFDDFLLTLEDLDMSYNNLRRYVFVSAVFSQALCIHTFCSAELRRNTVCYSRVSCTPVSLECATD